MYVEVSGRQSGKTFRLITSASEWLLSDYNHNVFIVTKRHGGGKNIKRHLPPQNRGGIYLTNDMTHIDEICDNNSMCFIDEFDYISEERLRILDNAFYYTTAKKYRDFYSESDFFTRLVAKAETEGVLHGYTTDRYFNPAEWPPEEYNVQIKNQYRTIINKMNRNGANAECNPFTRVSH